MMEFIERDITERLLEWKNSADRKPLIIKGARQIGKSWAVEYFGKRYYDNLAVFNFDRKRELADVFQRTKDPKRIIDELTFFTDKPLLPEKTLIFLDEIREVRNDPYTTNIIYDIKQKMLDLLATEACELGKLSDLMR